MRGGKKKKKRKEILINRLQTNNFFKSGTEEAIRGASTYTLMDFHTWLFRSSKSRIHLLSYTHTHTRLKSISKCTTLSLDKAGASSASVRPETVPQARSFYFFFFLFPFSVLPLANMFPWPVRMIMKIHFTPLISVSNKSSCLLPDRASVSGCRSTHGTGSITNSSNASFRLSI